MTRIAATLPLLLLAACSGGTVADTLGLSKHHAPDEYEVVSRPPLSVPKEFYLRPPSDGRQVAASPEEPHQAAHRMMTGLEAGTSDKPLDTAQDGLADTAAPVVQASDLASNGDEGLLKQIGADKVDPNVRHEISVENDAPSKTKDPSLLAKMRGETNKEPVVDASGEAARIKQAKAQGKPVDNGETPVDDPHDKSVLQRLFD